MEMWKSLLAEADEKGQAICQAVLTALGVEHVRRWQHISSEETSPELGQDAKAYWLAGQLDEAQHKAQNLVAILDTVAQEIRANPPDKFVAQSPDSETMDWFTRWQQAAANVSDDQMQAWWARLLMGQVVQPGTYSLSTLDLLRRLSPTEAKRIELAASQRLESGEISGIVKIPDNWRRGFSRHPSSPLQMSRAEVSELMDLGVLRNLPETWQLQFPLSLQGGAWKLVIEGKDPQAVQSANSPDQLDWYMFTCVGRELCRLSGIGETNVNYLHLLCEMFEKYLNWQCGWHPLEREVKVGDKVL